MNILHLKKSKKSKKSKNAKKQNKTKHKQIKTKKQKNNQKKPKENNVGAGAVVCVCGTRARCAWGVSVWVCACAWAWARAGRVRECWLCGCGCGCGCGFFDPILRPKLSTRTLPVDRSGNSFTLLQLETPAALNWCSARGQRADGSTLSVSKILQMSCQILDETGSSVTVSAGWTKLTQVFGRCMLEQWSRPPDFECPNVPVPH